MKKGINPEKETAAFREPKNISKVGVPMFGIYPDASGDHPMFGSRLEISEQTVGNQGSSLESTASSREDTVDDSRNPIMDDGLPNLRYDPELGGSVKKSPFRGPFYL